MGVNMKKNLSYRRILSVVYMTVALIGCAMVLCSLFLDFLLWLCLTGAVVEFFALFMYIKNLGGTHNSKKKNNQIMKMINDSIVPLTDEEIIEQYCYSDIVGNKDDVLKVFYSDDLTSRIMFVKSNGNMVTVEKYRLTIFDEAERDLILDYAVWEPCYVSNSYYADLDLAINDCTSQLVGYNEVLIDKLEFNNNVRYSVNVEWILPKDGGLDKVPFGSRYTAIVKFVNDDHQYQVRLFNNCWVDYYNSCSVMYSLNEDFAQLPIGTKFTIYDNVKLVGYGEVEFVKPISKNTILK